MPKRKYGYKRGSTKGKKRRRVVSRKKRSTRTSFGKTPAKRASITTIRSPTGLGDLLRVKLRYVEQTTFTGTAGVQAYVTVMANSCFDPNSTGTGHQPYFFDQWKSLYLRYRVLGASIKWRVWQNGSLSTIAQANYKVVCVATTQPTALVAQTINGGAWKEQPYSKESMIGGTKAYTSGFMNMSTQKIWATNNQEAIIAEDSYSALTTANPAAPWYFVLGMQVVDGTQNWGAFVEWELTQWVQFEEPIVVSQS